VVEEVKGVLIKFCCLNNLIRSLEKPGTYNLFIADYGVYPLYLNTPARNISIHVYGLILWLGKRYFYPWA
jgi:hypothetical protein